MAGSATTELKVLVNTPGVEKLPQLSCSLKLLRAQHETAVIIPKNLANILKNGKKILLLVLIEIDSFLLHGKN